MIELFTGENSYERTLAVSKRTSAFTGEVTRLDGAAVEPTHLPDIFSGLTLFATTRLIIIDQLSANTSIWPELPAWAGRLHDDTTILLIEPKPDKRTATYKWLKSHAEVHEFTAYTMRDRQSVESWLAKEASTRKLALDASHVRLLVERVGVDQWQLSHALDKLALLDDANEQTIVSVIDARPEEHVFVLLETALRGDSERVQRMLLDLRRNEDAYKVFGLLTSQVIQLSALVLGLREDRNVAKDFGASPYVLNKLRPFAARLGERDIAAIVSRFAAGDRQLKTSQVDPWLVIEQSLREVARAS